MPVNSISVVIPTLNAAETITDALESVQRQSHVLEVVCVDAGSEDGTKALIQGKDRTVIQSRKGRGVQISAGVARCRGDVIFVLHADCRLFPGAFSRMMAALNRIPRCVGGSLGMRYQNRSFHHRFLAFLNNTRARFAGISFGDQGQFFKKSVIPHINGFPDQMLMEDIELSLRLKAVGKVCFIPNGITVIRSRWDSKGFFPGFKRDILLCMEYLIKRHLGLGDPSRKDFYKRYYDSE